MRSVMDRRSTDQRPRLDSVLIKPVRNYNRQTEDRWHRFKTPSTKLDPRDTLSLIPFVRTRSNGHGAILLLTTERDGASFLRAVCPIGAIPPRAPVIVYPKKLAQHDAMNPANLSEGLQLLETRIGPEWLPTACSGPTVEAQSSSPARSPTSPNFTRLLNFFQVWMNSGLSGRVFCDMALDKDQAQGNLVIELRFIRLGFLRYGA